MSRYLETLDRLAAAAHNLRLDLILAAHPVLNCLTIPREPDFVIGRKDDPYLRRWWVIPRNRFFNIYLHQILRDDDDRAEHDHPWASCSIILKGGYLEIINGVVHQRRPGTIRFRRSIEHHRLTLITNRWRWTGVGRRRRLDLQRVVPCWTLFITGPKVREWGFYCKNGWVHWKDFCDPINPGERGKGCGD